MFVYLSKRCSYQHYFRLISKSLLLSKFFSNLSVFPLSQTSHFQHITTSHKNNFNNIYYGIILTAMKDFILIIGNSNISENFEPSFDAPPPKSFSPSWWILRSQVVPPITLSTVFCEAEYFVGIWIFEYFRMRQGLWTI